MLFRRAFLTALPLGLLPLGLAAPALRAQTADPARAIAQVEAFFNGITTLRARFLQLGHHGQSAEGTARIWRPGRMRFDYDPPEPTLLIAADGQFFHWDRLMREASIVPLSSTPFAMLLRDPLELSGEITVEGVERAGGVIRLTLHRTGREAEGRIQLVFDETPMMLRQWAVQDAQGFITRVTLTEITLGERFDPFQFAFNDPRFREELEQAR